MELVVIGMNHHSHSLFQRESWNIPQEKVEVFLKQAKGIEGVKGVLYLSTCNRLEVYGVVQKREDKQKIWECWQTFVAAEAHSVPYCYWNDEAFHHLVRVASGLDAMVLGENEVMGQVKRAYAFALSLGVTGALLNFTFQKAFQMAKKVRSQTGVGRYPASVSTVALSLLEEVYGSFENLTGLVVGLGEMGKQIACFAKQRGVGELLLCNRTESKARDFAEEIGGEVIPPVHLEKAVCRAHFVVSSTSSAEPVLCWESLERHGIFDQPRPFVFVDLGVPRDIESKVGEEKNVYLYDMGDLGKIAEKNRVLREKEVAVAEDFIQKALDSFCKEWSNRALVHFQGV